MTRAASRNAGFLVLAIAVVALALGLLTHDYMRELRDARFWVGHTHEVTEIVKDLGLALRDAERGQRGFLVTGRDEYLAPYGSALDRIALLQGELLRLTTDNPAQQARLRALAPVIQRKLEELGQTIALHRRAGGTAALALVETDRGRQLMDGIEAGLADLQAEERRLLAQRQAALGGADARATWFSLGGAGLLAGLLALCAWVLARGQPDGRAARPAGEAPLHDSAPGDGLSAPGPEGATASLPRSPAWPALLGLFGAAYLGAILLGRSLSLQSYAIATVWPASGLYLAGALLTAPRRWMALIGAATAAHLVADVLAMDKPPMLTLCFAGANAAEMLAGTALVRLLGTAGSGGIAPGRKLRDTLALGAAALAAPAVGATLGAGALTILTRAPFGAAWPVWWAADALGMLVTAPLVLAAARAWHGRRGVVRRPTDWIEGAAALATNLAGAAFVFLQPASALRPIFLILPPLLWVALRLGVSGVTATVMTVVLVAAAGTAADLGPFAVFDGPAADEAVGLQVVLFISAAAAYLLAAVGAERRAALARVLGANAALEAQVRRRTAALAESEARFRAMADNAPAMIWVTDAVGQCTYLSRPWCAFTGQREADGLGLGWLNAVHPEDRARAQAAFLDANARHQPYRIEIRLRRAADDGWAWVIDAAVPRFGSEGKYLGYIGSALDITERRAAEAAVRESEARLRLAQRAGRIGSFDWDVASGRAAYSEEYVALHGLPPGTVTESHESWRARIHPEDRERAVSAVGRLDEDAPPAIEYRIVRPSDGAVRWIAERREVFRDAEGRPLRVIGSQQDVTERREAEAVLARSKAELERLVEERTRDLTEVQTRLAHAQRMEALGQLAGGIAHDFNNVLQAVQGGAGLIERRADGQEEVRRLARMVAEAAERGAAITRRLLAFSRRGELRTEAVDPAALLGGLREVLCHTLGAAVTVRAEAEPGLPMLLADKGQLETVLVNLATNARDAMPGGGVLTFSAGLDVLGEISAGGGRASGSKPGRYVRLCVADTGTGMPPEVLARVTEPFFTTKDHGKGTGLGLAMAKGFAEQSGGALAISSVPGQGTTVTLWLPVAARPQRAPAPAARVPARLGQRTRVLLVDDELLVREVTAEGLEAEGYTVLLAASGAEALTLLDAGEPADVIVSDLSMPGMDGIATIREAQRRYPGLPAILLTGFASNAAELAVGGALSGSFTLLRKPATAEQLGERIELLLEGAEGWRSGRLS